MVRIDIYSKSGHVHVQLVGRVDNIWSFLSCTHVDPFCEVFVMVQTVAIVYQYVAVTTW